MPKSKGLPIPMPRLTGGTRKKVLALLVGAVLLYLVVKHPTESATHVRDAADALGTFVHTLFN